MIYAMSEETMQKAILEALQQKYIEGYNDARESIAKQIESGCSWGPFGTINVCGHCENSADIARGLYGDL